MEAMEPANIYGAVLVALGGWASFTTWKTVTSRGGWREHWTLVLLGIAFVASCLLPGIALLTGRFAPHLLLPLGACYLGLLPFPCYFRRANLGRARTVRTIVFLLTGAALVAAGLRLLPVAWFGL